MKKNYPKQKHISLIYTAPTASTGQNWKFILEMWLKTPLSTILRPKTAKQGFEAFLAVSRTLLKKAENPYLHSLECWRVPARKFGSPNSSCTWYL